MLWQKLPDTESSDALNKSSSWRLLALAVAVALGTLVYSLMDKHNGWPSLMAILKLFPASMAGMSVLGAVALAWLFFHGAVHDMRTTNNVAATGLDLPKGGDHEDLKKAASVALSATTKYQADYGKRLAIVFLSYFVLFFAPEILQWNAAVNAASPGQAPAFKPSSALIFASWMHSFYLLAVALPVTMWFMQAPVREFTHSAFFPERESAYTGLYLTAPSFVASADVVGFAGNRLLRRLGALEPIAPPWILKFYTSTPERSLPSLDAPVYVPSAKPYQVTTDKRMRLAGWVVMGFILLCSVFLLAPKSDTAATLTSALGWALTHNVGVGVVLAALVVSVVSTLRMCNAAEGLLSQSPALSDGLYHALLRQTATRGRSMWVNWVTPGIFALSALLLLVLLAELPEDAVYLWLRPFYAWLAALVLLRINVLDFLLSPAVRKRLLEDKKRPHRNYSRFNHRLWSWDDFTWSACFYHHPTRLCSVVWERMGEPNFENEG